MRKGTEGSRRAVGGITDGISSVSIDANLLEWDVDSFRRSGNNSAPAICIKIPTRAVQFKHAFSGNATNGGTQSSPGTPKPSAPTPYTSYGRPSEMQRLPPDYRRLPTEEFPVAVPVYGHPHSSSMVPPRPPSGSNSPALSRPPSAGGRLPDSRPPSVGGSFCGPIAGQSRPDAGRYRDTSSGYSRPPSESGAYGGAPLLGTGYPNQMLSNSRPPSASGSYRGPSPAEYSRPPSETGSYRAPSLTVGFRTSPAPGKPVKPVGIRAAPPSPPRRVQLALPFLPTLIGLAASPSIEGKLLFTDLPPIDSAAAAAAAAAAYAVSAGVQDVAQAAAQGLEKGEPGDRPAVQAGICLYCRGGVGGLCGGWHGAHACRRARGRRRRRRRRQAKKAWRKATGTVSSSDSN